MRLPHRRLSTSRLASGAIVAAVLLAGAVAVPLSASADTAGDHYVNCAAKTNGVGTQASPWNSISAVNAHGDFAPGDRILLKRGTTCNGQLAPKGSGTSKAPIVIGAWGSGAKPTVAGRGTANNTGAVQIINGQWWTVQDLHITNKTSSANPSTYRSGLLFYNNGVGRLAGLVAQRLTIDTVRSNPGNGNTRAYGGISALTFGAPNGSGFDGLKILNNSISDVSRSGIVVSNAQYPKAYDTSVRISGNTVKHVRGDGIILIGSQHGRIDHNTVAAAGDLGSCAHCGRIGGPSTASAGIWPASTRWTTIDHNEVRGTYKTGGDGEGFDIDRSARDTVVEYNYAHDNQGGGVLLTGAQDSTIRFNILQNNGLGALTFYGKAPSTNTTFINNTVYISKKANAKVVRTFGAIKGSKVVFKNNLIYSYGPGTYQWPTKQVSTAANTLIGIHGTGRPHDSRTSYANPGLRSPGNGKTGFASLKKAYVPKHPASFKRGVAISKTVKTDIFGKKINPAKPPRGAAG